MSKFYFNDRCIIADSIEEAININNCVSEEETEYLMKEEQKAIDDYKAAIRKTTDKRLLKLYAHILKEEIEHFDELRKGEVD